MLRFWEGDNINDVKLGVRFDVLLQTQDIKYNRIVMRIPSQYNEHLYGLGEQFTDFNLKGHKYTIWTREQGGYTRQIFFIFPDLKNFLFEK